MVDMYKAQNNKIISFANYYVGKNIRNKKQLINNKNYKKLLYSGSISIDRGLLNMIKMMEFLPDDYQLNIAGQVSEFHKNKIPKKLEKRIILHGYLNQKDLRNLYINCGIGLIMFNNVGQYFMSYSLKLFEYINFGMFIILPNFWEWAKFNDIYKVGINLDVSSPKLCADKIIEMNLSILKNNSMHNLKISKNFDWKCEIKNSLTFTMIFIRRIMSLSSFKNVFVLSPHTDDGELGAGATIAKLNQLGANIYYFAFSTAEKSVPKISIKIFLRQK